MSAAGSETRAVAIKNLIVAGWTGRDAEATEKHIRELEEIGVPRPPSTPCFYRVTADQLTTGGDIQVIGSDSSGEVEFFLLSLEDGMWVGTGSDHTDRKVEAVDVTVSKQMCAKPIAQTLWRYDDVAPHWYDLILRSHITENGAPVLYQEGPVTTMRSPENLIELYGATGNSFGPGSLMFCGTLTVQGGVRPADDFIFELSDPVLNRTIKHRYDMTSLPAVA